MTQACIFCGGELNGLKGAFANFFKCGKCNRWHCSGDEWKWDSGRSDQDFRWVPQNVLILMDNTEKEE